MLYISHSRPLCAHKDAELRNEGTYRDTDIYSCPSLCYTFLPVRLVSVALEVAPELPAVFAAANLNFIREVGVTSSTLMLARRWAHR